MHKNNVKEDGVWLKYTEMRMDRCMCNAMPNDKPNAKRRWKGSVGENWVLEYRLLFWLPFQGKFLKVETYMWIDIHPDCTTDFTDTSPFIFSPPNLASLKHPPLHVSSLVSLFLTLLPLVEGPPLPGLLTSLHWFAWTNSTSFWSKTWLQGYCALPHCFSSSFHPWYGGQWEVLSPLYFYLTYCSELLSIVHN